MADFRASHPLKIAVVGNHIPRHCGIATFTTDLCHALSGTNSRPEVFTIAMNDQPSGYAYPDRVRYEIDVDDISGYRQAAEFINISEVDVVSVQHEFRIFGGTEGSHLEELLRHLRVPSVVTLHTVLLEPTDDHHRSMAMLRKYCDRFVVMSDRGVNMLQQVFDVEPDRIEMIPHGIPDVPFVDPNFYRDQYDLEGRRVMLTFGLLSPTKGLENVIEAMPDIVDRHPDVMYIVLGRTHPHERLRAGESYRDALQERVRELGLQHNVRFHNEFVDRDELIRFLILTDIYITPYLNEQQITSGTLAYAFGAGKAVISTPYWHAEELLAEGRGRLVPFADPEAIAEQVIDLLDNPRTLHGLRKHAYMHARDMTWSKVAQSYLECFGRSIHSREQRSRPASAAPLHRVPVGFRTPERPPLRLDHLMRMTNGVGVLQHAEFGVPRYEEGYATADNARALMLAATLTEDGPNYTEEASALVPQFLAFVRHAFDERTGRFRELMTFDRRWLDSPGSEECHGRCLCALGVLARRSPEPDHRDLAIRLLERALPESRGFSSPRSIALAMIGLAEYSELFSGDSVARSAMLRLTERLLNLFCDGSAEDWPWFERVLTYENARLPHALILAGHARGEQAWVERGLRALRWLMEEQQDEPTGHFVPIGTEGFYRRGGRRSRFAQIPIEAEAAVSACIAAWRTTGSGHWLREADRAFAWFLGHNDLGVPLVQPTTGACADGLNPKGASRNRGAGSTISYLIALAELLRVSDQTPASSSSAEPLDRRPGSAIELTRQFPGDSRDLDGERAPTPIPEPGGRKPDRPLRSIPAPGRPTGAPGAAAPKPTRPGTGNGYGHHPRTTPHDDTRGGDAWPAPR